jgi:hypothetical protein
VDVAVADTVAEPAAAAEVSPAAEVAVTETTPAGDAPSA